MKGGKIAFRKLADLMRVSIYFSDGYNDFLDFLKSETKKYKCDIEDLELSDDDKIYEIEW